MGLIVSSLTKTLLSMPSQANKMGQETEKHRSDTSLKDAWSNIGTRYEEYSSGIIRTAWSTVGDTKESSVQPEIKMWLKAGATYYATFTGTFLVVGGLTFAGIRRASPFLLPMLTTPTPLLHGRISLAFGLGASALVANKTANYVSWVSVAPQLVRIPYVPGASYSSHALCPVVLREHARFPKDFWDQNEKKLDAKTLHQLAEGCRKRKVCQARILKDVLGGQMTPWGMIQIPFPGVDVTYEYIAGLESDAGYDSVDWVSHWREIMANGVDAGNKETQSTDDVKGFTKNAGDEDSATSSSQ